jgi:hypothetical protein
MPRATTAKPHPAGSKPYPKISKDQAEQIAKTVAGAILLALAGGDDANDQTSYSDDEAADQQEEDDSDNTMNPSPSKPHDSSLQTAIAPFEAEILKATQMLNNIRPYLANFVSTANQKGITESAAMIVKYEKAIVSAKAEIASLTQAWEARERIRKQAEEDARRLAQEKKEDPAKAKGKQKAFRNEGKTSAL